METENNEDEFDLRKVKWRMLSLLDMKEFKRRKPSFITELDTLRDTLEEHKYKKKEQDLKDKEVEKILFDSC